MKWMWMSLVAALSFTLSCTKEPETKNRVAASFHAEELPENYQADLKKRPVFPFSVVPGGTVGKEDAKARAKADPVVRQHYQGIQLDSLQPFRLTKPAQGYVSYRVGNRVFWTSRRLYLKPGELLLSDGKNLIRGRCGNRVSLDPQQPVMPAGEPTEAALDLASYDMPNFTGGALDPNLFKLAQNLPGPASIQSTSTPAAESFSVAPSPHAPGMITGGLPGGLSDPGQKGSIYLETGYFGVFPVPPSSFDTPSLPVPPVVLPPFPVVYNWPGPTFYTYPPTGLETPPFIGWGGVPLFPGGDVPNPFPGLPPYVNPPFYVREGTPPFVVPPDTVIPPGETTNPPSDPPNNEPPPGFEIIPEPSTVWMVGLAAVVLLLAGTRARL